MGSSPQRGSLRRGCRCFQTGAVDEGGQRRYASFLLHIRRWCDDVFGEEYQLDGDVEADTDFDLAF